MSVTKYSSHYCVNHFHCAHPPWCLIAKHFGARGPALKLSEDCKDLDQVLTIKDAMGLGGEICYRPQ